VQNRQEEDDSVRKVVLKKMSCDVQLDVVTSRRARLSTRGRLNTQICQEKRRLVPLN